MTNYETRINIRWNRKELKLMKKAIREYPDTYESVSNFIRANAIKELRRLYPKEWAAVNKNYITRWR